MIEEIILDSTERMEKTISVLKVEFNTIRVGRANPHVLDRITVDYYGAVTPLNQVGNISVPEPRMLMITPWDASLVKEIEKAILKSDIGINPSNDGKVIRLIFPDLTEDRRRELVKQVSKLAEDAKVGIRAIRRDLMAHLKQAEKTKEITEDDLKDYEKEVQETTDKHIDQIEREARLKENEIMAI